MAEIPFEYLGLALEATRGTAIAAPTHQMNVAGVLKPFITNYRPREARGTLAMNYRVKPTRKGCEWSAEGDADVNYLPVWLNMAMDAVTSPTTPGGATLSRLWTHTRNLTADDLKSATLFALDPNLASVLQAPFCMVDELVIENDATGEGVATLSVKGKGGFPTKLATPAQPASIAGDTLPGQMMQLWVDTASAIGTTAISGRLLKAKHTFATGVTYKYADAGPTASLAFTRAGRLPTVGVKTELEFELLDFTQYDQWAAGTTLKVRVRHNGALIETTAGPVNWYNYLEVDQYGPWDELDWGENEGSNRTVRLVINSQYDATLASDVNVKVQSARTTL